MIPVPYGSVSVEEVERFSGDVCIFSDLELLDERAKVAAVEVARSLANAGNEILNRPDRTMTRERLLKTLALRGINDFSAHRVTEADEVRFPAFLRSGSKHHGNFTPLLWDGKHLERAVIASLLRGRDLKDLLIVEFRDTADADGLFRKYGAFALRGEIIPVHVFFGHDWMVKHAGVRDDKLLEEELAYVRSNPHEKELLDIVGIAGVDYGRIDYGIADGKIQVWEINTNPNIGSSRSAVPQTTDHRIEVRDLFLQRFATWLASVDRGGATVELDSSDPFGVCPPVHLQGVARRRTRPPLARRATTIRDQLVRLLAGVLRPVLMPAIMRSLRPGGQR